MVLDGWIKTGKNYQNIFQIFILIQSGIQNQLPYIVKQFCFNDAKVTSDVIINQNKINVVNQYDSTDFDRVISCEIIKDDSCHLEFAVIVIDEYKI